MRLLLKGGACTTLQRSCTAFMASRCAAFALIERTLQAHHSDAQNQPASNVLHIHTLYVHLSQRPKVLYLACLCLNSIECVKHARTHAHIHNTRKTDTHNRQTPYTQFTSPSFAFPSARRRPEEERLGS